MRKFLTMAFVLALAGCSGGSGSSPAAPVQPVSPPQSNLVTPQFMMVFPTTTSSHGRAAQRAITPNRVSPATLSVTITRTTQPTITPTTATTAISPASCPCTVNGPASPPGVSNTFTINTFDTSNGTGNNLDTGSVTFTPTAGVNNPQTITLMGIPKTATITNVPAAFAAGTASQTATLTVTVKDAASQTIASGTYANSLTLSDPQTVGTQASQVTGTHVGTCAGTCITLNGPADVATLNYGGLAQDPVTLSLTGTGLTTATASFTPVLSAITLVAGGPTSTLGGVPGFDLYTSDNTSPAGYSATISYKETGYTNSPYNKTLTSINGSSCGAFATIAALANVGAGQTDFTGTSIASPAAGTCTRVISDGLAASGHGSGGPQFLVTYTTSGVGTNSKHRHQ